MQKTIKRIALLLAVALAVVCMGVFASACNDAKEYTITVYYSDGKTVVDGTKDEIEVQICQAGEGGMCYTPTVKVNANGVASYSIAEVDAFFNNAESYVIHIYAGRDALKTEGGEITVSKSNPSVKVVLSDRTAP